MSYNPKNDHYKLDFDNFTVIAVDQFGQETDLNADGEPCRSLDELGGFIRELYSVSVEGQGFDAQVRDDLLELLEVERAVA